ncbi:MAG TPA: tetratricopeptide repeat protein [Candidatus Eremiobacteraeota bacterium]|nr:MAG: Serine/threonine-protein kinase C [bacterium ADurb.Bin363]HPZ08993.1 tetratricopeptide repeat protein [Candidatus Eremiobacteraeota bacterium]
MAYICPKCYAENKSEAKFCSECGLSLGFEDVPTELKALTSGIILANRYEIIKKIKSGGMGSVYKTRHVSLGKIYAIKELINLSMNHQEQQEAITRFKMEAKILSELNHSNMPSVSDYFSIGGRYYLVMDFIEGKDLSTILAEKGNPGLPEADVVDWSAQICDVLSYLHTRNPPIIYRDIKPSNIMIRESDNKAILIDFGIVRTVQTEEDMSLTKTAIGTIGYMSPEQYRGKPEQRSDIYSLGATMYHLLTGTAPIPFNFQSVMKDRTDLSEETNAVVMTAVRLKPQERFTSALEMKKALTGMVKVALPVTEEADKADLMILQLNVPDSKIKRFAIKTIGEIKTEKAVKPLISLLKKEQDWEVRKITVETLAKFRLNDQAEELMKEILINDENPQVRAAAAQAMGIYENKTFSGPLILALNDMSDEVRMRAIIALGKLKDERALEPLNKIIQQEKEGTVKEEALMAIELISPAYLAEWRTKELEIQTRAQQKKTITSIVTIGILLVAGIFLFNIINKAYKEQQIKDHLKKGFVYLKADKKKEARNEFTKTISLSSKTAMAYYGTGLTYMEENNRNAMDNFEKAIKYDPHFPWNYVYSGNIYAMENNYEKAISYLEKSRTLLPDNQDIYIYLGEVYYASGQTQKAKKVFEEYLGKFPEGENTNTARRWMAIMTQNSSNPQNPKEEEILLEGYKYYQQGNYDEAIRCFQKLISINASNAHAYYGIGLSYYATDKKKSKEYIKKAVEYDPKYIKAYISLAEVCYSMEDYNGTIDACKKGLELSPETAKLYLLLGVSHFYTGNKNGEALPALNKYLELEPHGKNADTVKKMIEQLKQ